MLRKEKGNRAERLKSELAELVSEVDVSMYKKLKHPFPAYTPEPGRYQNNIGFVARFDYDYPIDVDGASLKGPMFEFCYIRDDRDKYGDPSSLHINVGYRILGQDEKGNIYQGSYTKGDHFLSPVFATSFAYIEKRLNIDALPDEGNVDDLVERGLILRLPGIANGGD